MANIKSQIKRNRQNEKRRIRNRVFRGRARTFVTRARVALAAEDSAEAKAAVIAAVSELDKAVGKGIIHKNNAARRKSRLMKRLTDNNRLSIHVAPLHIGPLVEAHLFHQKDNVILTSATLRTADSYDYVRQRLHALFLPRRDSTPR